MPDQTSNSGKFLKTDGSSTSWDAPLPAQTSKAGYTLQTNGTTASWENIPRSGSFVATSSGSITQGEPVGLNSNGTVSQLASAAGSLSSAFAFAANTQDMVSACYDPVNERFVIAYIDAASDDVKAVVGNITGTDITYGSLVNVATGTFTEVACCYESTSGTVVLSFINAGTNKVQAVAGTIDTADDSITFGTTYDAFTSTECEDSLSMCAHPAEGCIFIAFVDDADSDVGVCIAGTVSGTEITFGSTAEFDPGVVTKQLYGTCCCYDTEFEKIILGWVNGGDGDCRIVSLSGTAISFPGAIAEFAGTCSASAGLSVAYDQSKKKCVFAFSGSSDYGAAQCMDVISGADLVMVGTGTLLNGTSACSRYSCVYDSVNEQTVIVFTGASSYGKSVVCTISESTFSVDTAETFLSAAVDVKQAVFFEALGRIVICSEVGTSPYGKSWYKDFSYNLEWIGLADSTVSTATSLIVNTVGGVNTKQTGLTPGEKYYLDIDANLTTSATAYGEVGVALTSTSILITKGGLE